MVDIGPKSELCTSLFSKFRTTRSGDGSGLYEQWRDPKVFPPKISIAMGGKRRFGDM